MGQRGCADGAVPAIWACVIGCWTVRRPVAHEQGRASQKRTARPAGECMGRTAATEPERRLGALLEDCELRRPLRTGFPRRKCQILSKTQSCTAFLDLRMSRLSAALPPDTSFVGLGELEIC